jgi:ketosteroid isomerase-like protein
LGNHLSISKKAAVSMSAASLVLGLGIGAGATAYLMPHAATPGNSGSSSVATPSASASEASSTPESVNKKTQAEAKKTVDAFLEDVRKETVAFANGRDDATSLKEYYSDSYSHLQAGLPVKEGEKIIGQFSTLFMIDGEAKVETEETDFLLEGDVASIRGDKFKVTIDGKTLDNSDSEGSGKMVLVFADDKWSISKLEK